MSAAGARALGSGRFTLEREAFTPRHDAPFLVTPALARRESMLVHLVFGSGCVVALVDAPGAGKTALLRRLTAHMRDRAECAWVEVGQEAGPERVLQGLGRALGLRGRDRAAGTLREMRSVLDTHAGAGRLTVVTLDDAHNLTPGAVQMLFALASHWKASGLRLFLGGRPALIPMLEEAVAGSRLPLRLVDVPPLDREAVGDLIHLHMYQAGLHGDSPFTERRIARIARGASGRPGRIVPLARAVLREQARATSPRRRSLALLTAVLILTACVPLVDVTVEWLSARLSSPRATGNQADAGFESAVHIGREQAPGTAG